MFVVRGIKGQRVWSKGGKWGFLFASRMLKRTQRIWGEKLDRGVVGRIILGGKGWVEKMERVVVIWHKSVLHRMKWVRSKNKLTRGTFKKKTTVGNQSVNNSRSSIEKRIPGEGKGKLRKATKVFLDVARKVLFK